MSITAVVASVPDAVDAPATVAQDDMRGAQQGPNPNDTGPLTSYRLFVTDSRGRIASMAKEVYPSGETRGIAACDFQRGVMAASPLADWPVDVRIRPRRRDPPRQPE